MHAIRIAIASPEQIRSWSCGEVTRSATLEFRDSRPEPGGLFCERIFGPTSNWQCACGRYRHVRFAGVTCERCGVEVAHSSVRRERMGHVELAVPVAHIWYMRGVPSHLSLLLGIPSRDLQRVIYLSKYIITDIDEGKIQSISRKQRETERPRNLGELQTLRIGQILSECDYERLTCTFGSVFKADTGAGAIREVLQAMDLDALSKDLRVTIPTTKSRRARRQSIRRLRVVEALRRSGSRPEWMILTVLPIMPAGLRPMVQLESGRFATSDLNDLYLRVVSRNNRLKRLLDIGAPDFIVRNEKRMLQEAVDSLIDNRRPDRIVCGQGGRPLVSLSEMLIGKQGHLRRNMLGKRVDYSGRAVVIVGPDLELHQCGLPRRMAMELFRPFVINRLLEYNCARSALDAQRLIEQRRAVVWEVLEEVIQERPVLLDVAPTLHRLSIQAFQPVLVDGDAIQIHPLLSSSLYTDFGGRQIVVHVPLSKKAVVEARELMFATRNLLDPSNGEPIVYPQKDVTLGCYYMTTERRTPLGPTQPAQPRGISTFADLEEVWLAYELGKIDLHAPIRLRSWSWLDGYPLDCLDLTRQVREALRQVSLCSVGRVIEYELTHGLQAITGLGHNGARQVLDSLRAAGYRTEGWNFAPYIETTVGRAIFNLHLPGQLRFVNDTMDNSRLRDLVAECYHRLGVDAAVAIVEELKSIGFQYATESGTSIAMGDITVPPEKETIVRLVSREVDRVDHQYHRGLITYDEQYMRTVELWVKATDDVTTAVAKNLDPGGVIQSMVVSGAVKGGLTPIRILAGMRGLVADSAGYIVPFPIRTSLLEGLTAGEFFVSSHGARQGLSEAIFRMTDAGDLYRRLVAVAQDVVILEDDCGTNSGIWIRVDDSQKIGQTMAERLLGRVAIGPVVSPQTGEIIVSSGTIVNKEQAETIQEVGLEQVYVRSPLTCAVPHGLCATCYGRDLARADKIQIGEAVGVVAAQSIGEQGTRLIRRASYGPIQGLSRVCELFEARVPPGEAVLADITGRVELHSQDKLRTLKLVHTELLSDQYTIPQDYHILAREMQFVTAKQVLARCGEKAITARNSGQILFERRAVLITPMNSIYPIEVLVPDGYEILVLEGQQVKRGDPLAKCGTQQITAIANGRVSTRTDTIIYVQYQRHDERKYTIGPTARVRVVPGVLVKAGQMLTEGIINPNRLFRIHGTAAVQMHLFNEIQQVYRSQGIVINDKHIEIIIRQMTNKVYIEQAGDTGLQVGCLMDRRAFESICEECVRSGGQKAIALPVLLGISKAIRATGSFLVAASFEGNTRTLAEAAIAGKLDMLRGMRERAIAGTLVSVGTGFREERPVECYR